MRRVRRVVLYCQGGDRRRGCGRCPWGLREREKKEEAAVKPTKQGRRCALLLLKWPGGLDKRAEQKQSNLCM